MKCTHIIVKFTQKDNKEPHTHLYTYDIYYIYGVNPYYNSLNSISPIILI